jgi:hypothetical protein
MRHTVTPGADILALRPVQAGINTGYEHSTLAFTVFTFDPSLMAREHRGPDSDRLIAARISGVAMRHASWREPAEDEIAAAAAELREVAGDHYIAVVKQSQPLLHARIKALPWRRVPAPTTRGTGHGRIETRTLKTAHVSRLDFPVPAKP